MKPLSVVRSVKAKNEDTLLSIPGVTGVDSGKKVTDGVRTEEPAIRVYVSKKKPLKDVPQNERIPKEIDGVKTDVIERRIVLHTTARKAVVDIRPMSDTDTYDPLVGGISIGPCSAVGGFVYTGTLGCMVRDKSTGDTVMLTNYHVIAEKWPVGEKICQPSRVDTGSCPGDVVGETLRSVISENVDGAIARITARSGNCTITEIGNITGTKAATDNMKVRKRGRTTGLTHGIVDSIDLTVNVPYDDGVHTLKNQIAILADTAHGTVIGMGGDSGSVVVAEDGKVVGLYFAGTEEGDFGVANPIAAVLDELNIEMCSNASLPEKRIREDWDFKWIREGGFKDRYKERALEKLIAFEAIDWDWLWRVNPPDWSGGWGGGGGWRGGWENYGRRDTGTPMMGGAQGGMEPGLETRLARLEAIASGRMASVRQDDASLSPNALRCIDFFGMAAGVHPNPLVSGGATFHVFDHTGAPLPQNRIDPFGLNGGHRTEVSHNRCDSVELTLIRTHNSAPTVRAFNGAGVEVASQVMTAPQGVPQPMTLSGAGIVRVVITAPQNEVWIMRYCHCSGKDRFKIEKFESKEIKEFKENIKERFKEIIKEKPEFKEWKDGPKELKEGPKELKDGPKELKEAAKELKEDFKEKPEPKELAEGPGGGGGWGGDPKTIRESYLDNPRGGDWGSGWGGGKPEISQRALMERLARLEAMLGGSHFIGSELRPDISRGALTREPDCGCRH